MLSGLVIMLTDQFNCFQHKLPTVDYSVLCFAHTNTVVVRLLRKVGQYYMFN